MRLFIFLARQFVVGWGLVSLLSCGSGDSSNSLTLPRAVIKNGSTTIAHVVTWTFVGGVVGVYIPSVDKYAVIELSTGLYKGLGVSEAATFYYTVNDCANPPLVIKNGFIGEIGKSIVYDYLNNKYFRVTAERNNYDYSSNFQNGVCSNLDGTVYSGNIQKICDIVETTRPYNFEPLAPLTVTFE